MRRPLSESHALVVEAPHKMQLNLVRLLCFHSYQPSLLLFALVNLLLVE